MLWIGPVGRLRGCPVVWHWRDFYGHRRLARSMARGADAIIAISRATFTFAADLLGGSQRRLALIRNGIADLPPSDDQSASLLFRSSGLPASGSLGVMAG